MDLVSLATDFRMLAQAQADNVKAVRQLYSSPSSKTSVGGED